MSTLTVKEFADVYRLTDREIWSLIYKANDEIHGDDSRFIGAEWNKDMLTKENIEHLHIWWHLCYDWSIVPTLDELLNERKKSNVRTTS